METPGSAWRAALGDLREDGQWTPRKPAHYQQVRVARWSSRAPTLLKKDGPPRRIYNFSVDPGAHGRNPLSVQVSTATQANRCVASASPSSRPPWDASVTLTTASNEEPARVAEGVLAGVGTCYYLNEKSSYRARRAKRFGKGRHFPALVSPKILPSFKRATAEAQVEDSTASDATSSGEAASPSSSAHPGPPSVPLTSPITISTARKQWRKSPPLSMPPFRPSGKPQRAPHTQGLSEDVYDSPRRVQREEYLRAKSRWIDRDFMPVSPGTSRSPLALSAPSTPHPAPYSAERWRPQTASARSAASTDTSVAQSLRRRLGSEAANLSNQHDLPIGANSRVSGKEPETPRSRGISPVDAKLLSSRPTTPSSQIKRNSTLNGRRRSSLGRGLSVRQSRSTRSVKHPSRLWCQASTPSATVESNEVSIYVAFGRVAVDGRANPDDIPKALKRLGHAAPNEEWIKGAFQDMGFAEPEALSAHDFLRFFSAYLAREGAEHIAAFKRADTDASGLIDRDELKEFLREFGIEPMDHVLDEVICEVDQDGNGQLDYDELKRVMELIRIRHGITASEYNEAVSLFRRFDRDESGNMDVEELGAALRWLGFVLEPMEVKMIADEVDCDKTGKIEENEWLTLLRKIRDIRLEGVRQVMKACDLNQNGKLEADELTMLLRSVGYVPEGDAVQEVLEEFGMKEILLDLGTVWRLLEIFRAREGLTADEIRDASDVYDRYDRYSEDKLGTTRVAKVVRSLGFRSTFEELESYMHMVDVDGSGHLSFQEVIKLVRMLHTQDLERFRDGFDEATGFVPFLPDNSENRKRKDGTSRMDSVVRYCGNQRAAHVARFDTLSVDEATELMIEQGCVDEDGNVERFISEDLTPNGQVDMYGYCRAAMRSRRKQRQALVASGGYSRTEVEAQRVVFDKFDADGSGEISGSEMIDLLSSKFPDLSHDPELRPQLLEILEEADEDGSGTLDFSDFLRIMRLFDEHMEERRLEKEQQVIKQTGFTFVQVKDFCALFVASAGGSSSLEFEDVRRLLERIVPMGARNTEELRRHFSASMRAGRLEFPDFLLLMKRLLDTNFANLGERTKGMVADT